LSDGRFDDDARVEEKVDETVQRKVGVNFGYAVDTKNEREKSAVHGTPVPSDGRDDATSDWGVEIKPLSRRDWLKA